MAQLLLALLLLAPSLATAQTSLAPYVLRTTASLAADATHTPSLPSAPPAGLMRVRVANVSSFNTAVKIQVPEVAVGSGARLLCTLATITANGDYLFAIGGSASSDVSGACLGVPPGWQLFLDHSAGTADVAVEVYPLAAATAGNTFGVPFGARNVTGAHDGLCLVHGPQWTTSAPAPVTCGSADTTQAEYQFVTPPGAVLTVRSVAIVEGGTTGATSAGDGVTFTARFRPLTGAAAAADSGITAEIDLHTPGVAQGGGATFPSGQVCPYTTQGCRLNLRIDTIDLGATDVDLQAIVFVTVS